MSFTQNIMTSDGSVGEEALTRALTAKNPVARIMARAAIADWSREFGLFVEDEFNRPNADHTDVLQAVWSIQVQLYLSVVAAIIDRGGDRAVVRAMVSYINAEGEAHLDRCRKATGS